MIQSKKGTKKPHGKITMRSNDNIFAQIPDTPEIILLLNNIMNVFVAVFLDLLNIVLPPFPVVCICNDFQQMQLMVTLFNILLF